MVGRGRTKFYYYVGGGGNNGAPWKGVHNSWFLVFLFGAPPKVVFALAFFWGAFFFSFLSFYLMGVFVLLLLSFGTSKRSI